MNARTLVVVGMIVVAALSRLVPHPPNFTPIGALALFGAAHFRSRWTAFLVPLAAMLLSDLGLEVITRFGLSSGWLSGGAGFHRGMPVVYGAIALIAAVGLLLSKKKTVLTVAAATLAASVFFFVITNFAVWAEGSMYPLTWDGLILCYTAAIPFFHWTLLGDACYSTILFGGFALAEKRFSTLQPAMA